MSPRLATVRLKKPIGAALRAGHPWVYADALGPMGGLASGQVVDVVDGQGRFVGRGLAEPASPIAVRLWTLEEHEAVDEALVGRRVAEALALRASLPLGDTDAYRVLNGEGDGTPGLVADRYADTVVYKLDGEAPRGLLAAAVRAVVAGLAPAGVRRHYLRLETGRGEVLEGNEPPIELVVREHGARFPVDVKRGQKTGFFLDQRDNRRLVAAYAAGAELLNLFAYTGGFSVAAALAGARRTTSVDQAQPAIDAAGRALALNGLDPRHHALVRAEVFALLDELVGAGRQFDVVVVDPPSFAPSERVLRRALKAYRELNARAAQVVRRGGLLFTASCSSHVTAEAFLEAVRDGLAPARRRPRLLELRGQPPDHPTVPAFSEGRYLKLAVLRLE